MLRIRTGFASLLPFVALVACGRDEAPSRQPSAPASSAPAGARPREPLPWPAFSPAQIAEAERLKVPVAYEDDRTHVQFVLIPGGTFRMGSPEGEGHPSERPEHDVPLSPYYMALTEVTNAQFEQFVNDAHYRPTAEQQGRDAGVNGPQSAAEGAHHPVVHVSWVDAEAYCRWAGARLPTEAQFERALRVGKEGAEYPWGRERVPPAGFGNFAGEECAESFRGRSAVWIVGYEDGYVGTSPAGTFSPNEYGLLDLSGNAPEWCQDRMDGGFYARPEASRLDPSNSSTRTEMRVIRGGSHHGITRCAERLWDHERSTRPACGFRPARSVQGE